MLIKGNKQFFTILYGQVVEQGPREVVPPLFLEVYRTQLGKAWSNLV